MSLFSTASTCGHLAVYPGSWALCPPHPGRPDRGSGLGTSPEGDQIATTWTPLPPASLLASHLGRFDGLHPPQGLQPCWVSADALASRFIQKASPWAPPPEGLQALPHHWPPLAGVSSASAPSSQLQRSLPSHCPLRQVSVELLQPTRGLGAATGALPPQTPGPHLLGSGWSGYPDSPCSQLGKQTAVEVK